MQAAPQSTYVTTAMVTYKHTRPAGLMTIFRKYLINNCICQKMKMERKEEISYLHAAVFPSLLACHFLLVSAWLSRASGMSALPSAALWLVRPTLSFQVKFRTSDFSSCLRDVRWTSSSAVFAGLYLKCAAFFYETWLKHGHTCCHRPSVETAQDMCDLLQQ